MHRTLPLYLLTLLLFTGLTLATPLHAEDALSKADAAVSNILFDEEADEFTSYSISQDGFVDITLARNTPDPLYSKILNKLLKHPDIKGVLAGKGGPICSIFI
jgi:hypothetical protein